MLTYLARDEEEERAVVAVEVRRAALRAEVMEVREVLKEEEVAANALELVALVVVALLVTALLLVSPALVAYKPDTRRT